MAKRLHPKIIAFGFLVATGWLPLAAKTLPVLFLPPPHYRVLRRLGNGGYPYFGGDMNVVVDRALLGHWQLEGLKAGATAILLVPECKLWVCPPGPRTPVHNPQKYAAEAIAVAGPVCAMPTGLCRRVQPSFVSFRRWTRAFDRKHRYSHRSFVVSVSVNDLVAKPSSPMRGIRSIQSTGRGRATCPVEGPPDQGWGDLPLVPVTVLVPVDSRGQVEMDHLTFTRFGTLGITENPYGTFRMDIEETIGRIVRHWRFKMPSHGARSFELIMNWHLIPLKAGQPIPTGVVCRYPAYPARHWQDGIMVRHMQWTLYKGKDHTWWATAARS